MRSRRDKLIGAATLVGMLAAAGIAVLVGKVAGDEPADQMYTAGLVWIVLAGGIAAASRAIKSR